MRKIITIIVTLFVLTIGTITPTITKVNADGTCEPGSNQSGNCYSEWHCVVGEDGCVYMQYTVCCSGHCFMYLERISCG